MHFFLGALRVDYGIKCFICDFQCDAVFNKDKKMTYSCVYMPQMEGEFRVSYVVMVTF